MTTLSALCTRFGIDEAAARAALNGEAQGSPWYAEAMLGVGGWLSAIALIVFVGAFLSLAIGVDDPGIEAAIAGFALFGAGTLTLKRNPGSLFARHFAVAFATAGAALAVGGIGVDTESLWAAAIVAAALAAIGIVLAREPILQFLLAGMAVTIFAVALWDEAEGHTVDLLALAAPAGLWLYLRPPRVNLRPLASVLLLTVPLADALLDLPALSWAVPEGWFARVVQLALFTLLIGMASRNRVSPATIAAGILAALVALLLPAGAAGALLLMMLAYALGHRPFAVIGAALAAWFIWRFYYVLDLSLLRKSILLVAVGMGCLALHFLLVRRGRAA